MNLLASGVHESWTELVQTALTTMDEHYLDTLTQDGKWLPGPSNIFRAFSLPLTETKYILFGESPYPRPESANGYAFWDAAVDNIWSENGLSKTVNRATSLRNFIKMLLVADGRLDGNDLSQPAIAEIDKSRYHSTLSGLFNNLIAQGVLLLNASLVLSQRPVAQEAKSWRPFIARLLTQLGEVKPDIELILFGKIAEKILIMPGAKHFDAFSCEHPYNISFIQNPNVINFFQPMKLLHNQGSNHVE